MPAKSDPNLIFRTLAVAGLATGVIAGMVAYQVRHAYTITVETHQREIQQLAQILDAGANTTFQSAELIVDHAAEEVIDQEAIPNVYDSLTDRFLAIASEWDFVYSVAYIDTRGKLDSAVVRDADGVLQPLESSTDFSTSNSFTYHSTGKTTDGETFYIADPVPALVSSSIVIPVSKAIYDRAGVFRGVSLVTVSLDTFSKLYSGLLPSTYRPLLRKSKWPRSAITQGARRLCLC